MNRSYSRSARLISVTARAMPSYEHQQRSLKVHARHTELVSANRLKTAMPLMTGGNGASFIISSVQIAGPSQ
ncbi:hypothetical protein AGR13a_Lc110092 [Agrobacterium genomosp. 13 str. CFBP 6927]|uniref:Uncharacterized protein n=1 Tax=Agrobacterium genomosp. 13 str. CFBP 6927 TaxID=1183428 RepID=A0ABM9VJE0_9HYPH|nr:hypothetical protein AGR13a_Lc110092 [Agrobacterium genomosp. 13 str. CFBP 6927]